MRLLTNAERQARWRAKRNALAGKAVLDKARKPWDLHEARKGDARGYANEVCEWWTAYEYRVRKELELCPATFSDQDDRAEMVRALDEVSEGMRQLKVRSSAVT
jgi:FMN phosphatase YigB (HAD superfamily)